MNKAIKIIKFESESCQPCKVMTGRLNELTTRLKDVDIEIENVDVEKNPEMRTKFRIMGLPTILIIRKSVSGIKDFIVETLVGTQTVKELKECIARAVSL